MTTTIPITDLRPGDVFRVSQDEPDELIFRSIVTDPQPRYPPLQLVIVQHGWLGDRVASSTLHTYASRQVILVARGEGGEE